MAGENSCTDLETEIILNEMTKMSDVQGNVDAKACIIRAYEKVDTPNARRQIKGIVKEVLIEISWKETRKEMREILANVHMREGEYEHALQEYRALLIESEYEKIDKKILDIKKRPDEKVYKGGGSQEIFRFLAGIMKKFYSNSI